MRQCRVYLELRGTHSIEGRSSGLEEVSTSQDLSAVEYGPCSLLVDRVEDNHSSREATEDAVSFRQEESGCYNIA